MADEEERVENGGGRERERERERESEQRGDLGSRRVGRRPSACAMNELLADSRPKSLSCLKEKKNQNSFIHSPYHLVFFL